MNLTMEKLFSVNLQKEDAELIITLLNQHKAQKSQRLAQDLNERFVWNYRRSAV